ncbi:MAG: hypothetical protein HS099_20230 [Ardenticatenaceae bacterium]|nr:hypothetical protein [Ardenticatenaceae bacterium]
MQNWRVMSRIVLKAAFLLVIVNGLFAVVWRETAAGSLPPFLGSLSLYNHLFPGRERLPYGENPTESYNLSLNSLPALFASHQLHQPKAADEFRVILLGDSGIWGWFLQNDETLAGQLNAMGIEMADGRRLIVYNLGYPIISLSKDLLLLDEAMRYDPDLILWPVTLESFALPKQLDHPILQHNPARLRSLIAAYGLHLDAHDPRFVEPDFWHSSLIGQRRALADWLRLQQVGVVWAATGIDQAIPAEIPLRQSDFAADVSWQTFDTETTLTSNDLAFDVLAAGLRRAGNVPVLIINEPIFISKGENSHLRYNLWYPRWAYDQYRALLAQTMLAAERPYLDLWDAVLAAEFTDSPVHLTPAGTAVFAAHLKEALEGK